MRHEYKAVFCVLTAFLVLSVLVNVEQYKSRKTGVVEVSTDTERVTYVDTVTYYKPVPKDSVILRYVTVRLPIADGTAAEQNHIADIGKMADSVQVALPIEQKRYSDDSTYTAIISGYEPRLDSIFVFPRREVITITTERTTYKHRNRRFGIGIQAGYGITQKGAKPYLGIGISYNLLSY